MLFPWLFNGFVTSGLFGPLIKRMLGFSVKRSIPELGMGSVRKWAKKHLESLNKILPADAPEVLLYMDEFTNYNDTSLGITSIRLLNSLGVRVLMVNHPVSGRTYISKGLLKKARVIAGKNVSLLAPLVSENRPLVGIEPSAILGFRDEFPELLEKDLVPKAKLIAAHSFTMEEYLVSAFEKGMFHSSLFTEVRRELKLHGHCQQKAIASTQASMKLLSIPKNYEVNEIPSGCCGMAGSFGYEREHYDLSMKVGELVLFPAVREASKETLIAAPGTSCRHQIKDGTGTIALHPVEILYNALK